LQIPPEEVDVNVHPQKKEARFREESKIYQLFEGAITETFGAPSFPEPLSFSPPPSFQFEERPFPTLAFPPPVDPLPFSYPERPLRVLGNYLLLERETVLLVDLKAAWARVLFESLKEEKGSSQSLLWPLEIALTREEAMEGGRIVAELAQIGIEGRFLGQKTIAIDALPAFLEEAQFPAFFAKWREEKQLAPVTTSFCRSFKRNYSLDEALSLWRKLQDCSDAMFDPLGNRIWMPIQETDFERMMKTYG
jgi:DNA mismatch repair protein MutL